VVVASWYGPEFHGKPTASGERFDMHALTCAHRELPFGTVVKVTNVANGKSVRCVVNDRGPFVAGRDIDLSYAAAREIGLRSTGPVTVEYLERDIRYVKEIGYAAGAKGPFTVQVGAFREKDNARRLKESLDLKYKEVYISETTIDNTTLYRVRIGKFPDKKKAYRLAKTLAEEGYSPLVTHYDEQI
jgi:rare lipoprotein A